MSTVTNFFNLYKENSRNFDQYRPLLDAAMDNTWELAEDFIKSYPDSVDVPITVCGRTALHIAAGAAHSDFVLQLLELMSVEALELKDSYDGNIALHLAVIAGLDEAVKAMVDKHRHLTHICNKKGLNPLLNAAIHVSEEHTEIIRLLCDDMKDEESSSFRGHLGALLICSITRADLYELAHYLISKHPSLATAQEIDGNTVLNVLADKGSFFLLAWPIFRTTRDERKKQKRASKGMKSSSDIYLELLDIIFKEISCLTKKGMYDFFVGSNFLKTAAENGAIEIVKKCVKTYPDQLWFPHEGRNIFQIAVENRRGNIFNYLYDHMNADEKILTTRTVESNGGNILHVAAKIAPTSRLNIFTSPVVQMQSEINWFKKVVKRVPRALGKMRNDDGETPQEVFTREHKVLVKQGEDYVIRTSGSCLVVAALVATVAFAAIFTIPGGNFSDSDTTSKGKPIFLEKKSFLVFMVVDALALLSSTTSILVFLSMFSSSYIEGNFEHKLPFKLACGLISLILSVINVIIAFSVAFSIILGNRYRWAPYLIGVVAFYSLVLSSRSLWKLFQELTVYTTDMDILVLDLLV
ncbi:hypothetical protein MKX03_000716 [Papaver bracteatum]|nr:hypothetical protein MKX03_000716 [Papaver bracteatum]